MTKRGVRQDLKEHSERAKTAPSSNAQSFKVGDPVWVERRRPLRTHRTKTRLTPGVVVRRVGQDTYTWGKKVHNFMWHDLKMGE